MHMQTKKEKGGQNYAERLCLKHNYKDTKNVLNLVIKEVILEASFTSSFRKLYSLGP